MDPDDCRAPLIEINGNGLASIYKIPRSGNLFIANPKCQTIAGLRRSLLITKEVAPPTRPHRGQNGNKK